MRFNRTHLFRVPPASLSTLKAATLRQAYPQRPLTHLPAAREVLLIADEVTKSYDEEKQLFSGLTFSVVEGDKLAICGTNGSGKSTLLKIMAGLDEFDAGSVQRNKGAKIGYLMQEPKMNESHTVMQAVLQSDSAVARAVQSYQRAVASSSGDVISQDLEKAIELMNTYSPMSWEIDSEAKRILNSVGISDKLFGSLVSKLSGGQRKRVALASCLLGKPDLLVLDEPTNHMDIEIIAWMEKELKSGSMAVVLVTHDRYFMESVCSRILELDNGKAVMHDFGGPGAYDRFREAREFRRKTQANAAQDARTLFRREAEWIAKQPKARQAKSQARVNAFVELTARTKDMPKEDVKVDFGSAAMMRQGNKVVKMIDVTYQPPGFSAPLIRNFNYDFAPGERLGIVGRNGAGKSTLLNLIAGLLPPSTGTREVGETTQIGYFTQYPPDVRGDLRLISYIKEIADDSKARLAGIENLDTPEMLLEKVGFSRQRQYQYVSSLSGGERRRLHLASVLVERPNLLILDEPTNDLDLQTVEVVEEVVRGFKGVLLVVSHDRAFMDNLCPKLLVLNGQDGVVRMFQGEYSDYLSVLEQEKDKEASERLAQLAPSSASTSVSSSSSSSKAVSPPPATRKISWSETQEYKKVQAEIVRLSKEKDKLDKEVMALAQKGTDMGKLEKTSVLLGGVVEKIEKLEERWMELAELAGDL